MCFDMTYCCLSTCSKVKVKFRGQGQRSQFKATGQGQRFKMSFFTVAEWSIVALPSTAKSSKKRKSGTLLKTSQSVHLKMVVFVICCCFDRLGVCGRARF